MIEGIFVRGNLIEARLVDYPQAAEGEAIEIRLHNQVIAKVALSPDRRRIRFLVPEFKSLTQLGIPIDRDRLGYVEIYFRPEYAEAERKKKS